MSDRAGRWQQLGASEWDVLIIGGGVAGAGLLREAAARGLRAALIEQRDIAWGSSGRSSKLIHGGLRYLSQLQFGLTRTLLRERDRLLAEAPGLVQHLPFLLSVSTNRRADRFKFRYAVTLYELLRQRRPRWDWVSAEKLAAMWRDADMTTLLGAWRYPDACADDARLVWRLIDSAVRRGALLQTYARAESLIIERDRVRGVRVRDVETQTSTEVRARLVINATGAWADELRGELSMPRLYRQLRGSHLVLDATQAPSSEAAAFRHPADKRYLFALPWEGRTVLGVTDLDHDQDMRDEPRATDAEIDYLLDGAAAWLPRAQLTRADVITTYSGVRAVVGTGRENTYLEKRDTVIAMEKGLLTVTAGKLTSFQVTVLDAFVRAGLGKGKTPRPPLFDPVDFEALKDLPAPTAMRLGGRFGARSVEVARKATHADLTPVADTPVLWIELREAMRHEHIVHLDDLMLRRTRLGQLFHDGGESIMARVGELCAEEMGWDDTKWNAERARYFDLWRQSYSSTGLEAALVSQPR